MRRLSLLSVLCLLVLALVSLPCVLAGRDFYSILGVKKSANEKQIKKAYRQMSKLYHPDKNKGDEESSKKFVDIAAAYETLSDKDKRRIYDQGGEEALKQQQGGGGARDPFDIFSGFGGFGGFGHQQQRGVAEERRGDDVRLDLDATLEDLYSGRVYEVLLKQQHLCPHCRGTGAESDSDVVKCSTCQGRGVVMKTVSLGPGFMQQMQQTCEVCGGRGKTIRHKCHVCSGRKVTTGTKKLDVVLEMGMPDGHAIEFENAADEHPDHAPGHVIFTVRTLPHQRFTRQGHDLHVTEIISLRESLVGFSHTLTHLDGHVVTLSSTRVTQHGDVQRVSREGMPHHNSPSRRGDLVVTYEVRFPATLTQAQREGLDKILPK